MADPSIAKRKQVEDAWLAAFFFVVVAVVWWWQWPTLNQPLVEAHAFRQTQTAYQTLTLSRGWGSLLHPKLPIFGAPWEAPFEFPLFQASAAIMANALNLANDTANRAMSLMWFTACFAPLWKVARLHLDRVGSGATIVLFATSPVALQWSRASLIDFCAVFFGLCTVYAAHRAWTANTFQWQVALAASGAITGMVKVTTLVTFAPMALVMTPGLMEALKAPVANFRRLLDHSWPWIMAAAATMWWTDHADAIKEANLPTRWITSSVLKDWTFGTMDQRRQFANWEIIFGRIDSLLVPKHSALILLLIPLLAVRYRRFAASALVSLVGSFVIFFNLFVVHDYYLVVLTPQAAILFGIGVTAATSHLSKRRRLPVTCVVILAILCVTLIPTKAYWRLSRAELTPPSNELTSLSTAEQQVLVGMNDWDPTRLYYADRKGLMLDPRGATIEWIRALPDLGKYDFYQGPPDFREAIAVRGWYGPVGVETVRLDDNRADLSDLGVAMSSLPSVPEFDSSSRVGRTINLACDGAASFDPSTIPAGTVARTRASAPNLVFTVPGLASVPVGTYVVSNPSVALSRRMVLTCAGGGTVEITLAE